MASTSPPPAPTPTHPHAPRPKDDPQQITIISHSNLYYWWPVWAFGFLMAAITWWEGYVMAVVPQGKENETGVAVDANMSVRTPALTNKGEPILDGEKPKFDETNHEGVVAVFGPAAADKAAVYHEVTKDGKVVPKTPPPKLLHMSPHKGLGVVYVLVLLLVISITNVPLRGMWSVLIIVIAVAATIVLIVLGWMETLLGWFWLLDIRINMGGYLTISTFLLLMWLAALLFFDKQRYITFTPGQFKVCDEVGGGEQVYSTDGMTLQKQRSDFFRHYVLGLGSGDLIIRTAGAQAHHIDLPNVLFINAKVRQIEQLLKTKNVIEMS